MLFSVSSEVSTSHIFRMVVRYSAEFSVKDSPEEDEEEDEEEIGTPIQASYSNFFSCPTFVEELVSLTTTGDVWVEFFTAQGGTGQ